MATVARMATPSECMSVCTFCMRQQSVHGLQIELEPSHVRIGARLLRQCSRAHACVHDRKVSGNCCENGDTFRMHELMHILHASADRAWSADRARALTCQNRSSASESMVPCPRVGVRATTSRDRPVMKSKQPGVHDAVPESSCETLHMILASLSLINHAHIATCDPSTSFKNFTEVENESVASGKARTKD